MSNLSLVRRPGAAFLLLGLATISQAATSRLLPIDSGTYVVAQKTPCRDAPLAAVVEFDGLALSGPHESDCTSVLLSRHVRLYRVSTRCNALGDGTQAKPFTQVQTIRVISRTRFSIGDGEKQIQYARCESFQ